MSTYNIIGIMSGTSLDGLDICFCNFELLKNKKWDFHIISASTVIYPLEIKRKLAEAKPLMGLDLMLLHNELGNFIGKTINNFISNNRINKKEIDCISSHGHTIFHQPKINLTTQIGNGANISSITQLPVVCDFRSTDVALNGQGAPLVPIGDNALFAEYDHCINLGGIANISYKENNNLIAFDICPTNIVLNKLAKQLGCNFDNKGLLAKSGNIDNNLLEKLNYENYYKKSPPKSLGSEWIEKIILPIIESTNISNEDKLRTFVEHIAIQISNAITSKNKKILFTGGGTLNSFLIERIKTNTPNEIIIPSKEIIDFKEALIFAFLGVLRLREDVNCLKSVTGAKQNNIGGCIYKAFQ
jgi:anhydro-N-acetylmuramic acid kinase